MRKYTAQGERREETFCSKNPGGARVKTSRRERQRENTSDIKEWHIKKSSKQKMVQAQPNA